MTPLEALRKRIEEPIYNRILKMTVGNGELEYEVYLKTKTLLDLQYPPSERVIHEELLFQIVHQAQELWLKLLCAEGVELVGELDEGDMWRASARIERMVRIQLCLKNEMSVICTLDPAQFQVIRRSLGTGSGQESPGFNKLTNVLARALEEAVQRLLERRGVTFMDVYDEKGSKAPDILRICEQLVDLDQAYQGWLMEHFLLVRRTIGVDRKVHALDGLPTNALVARMVHPLIPSLWDARVDLTKAWRPEGGYPVGADRRAPPPHKDGTNGVR
jgi:tryptophan 2,3-dioxygenase